MTTGASSSPNSLYLAIQRAYRIVAGPDGALGSPGGSGDDRADHHSGRHHPVLPPTPDSGPFGITVGPDGRPGGLPSTWGTGSGGSHPSSQRRSLPPRCLRPRPARLRLRRPPRPHAQPAYEYANPYASDLSGPSTLLVRLARPRRHARARPASAARSPGRHQAIGRVAARARIVVTTTGPATTATGDITHFSADDDRGGILRVVVPCPRRRPSRPPVRA